MGGNDRGVFCETYTPAAQQSGDVLAGLMGKAKDVVKVTLRHNPSIDYVKSPDLIFEAAFQ